MTAIAEAEKHPQKEPPGFGMVVAVLLELGIFTTFVTCRSVVGMLLCVAYVWFSASLCFFVRWLRDGE